MAITDRPFKIRVKCASPSRWYAPLIGKELYARESSSHGLVDVFLEEPIDGHYTGTILREDCVFIKTTEYIEGCIEDYRFAVDEMDKIEPRSFQMEMARFKAISKIYELTQTKKALEANGGRFETNVGTQRRSEDIPFGYSRGVYATGGYASSFTVSL